MPIYWTGSKKIEEKATTLGQEQSFLLPRPDQELLLYSKYSPDLAPIVYFMFTNMKK